MNANATNSIGLNSFVLFLIAHCIILSGCSSSPSAGDGEGAIQNRIKEQSEARIKLVKFKKSNGAQGELMGFKIYALDFEAEIEFVEDCKWVIGHFGQQLSFVTSKPVTQQQGGPLGQWIDNMVENPGSLVKQGQRMQISGVIRFVKKEKGWAVDGVELTHAAAMAGFAEPPSESEKHTTNVASTTEAGLDAATTAAVVGSLSQPPPEQPTNVARISGTDRQPTTGFVECRKKAEKGEAKAQYELAKMFIDGKGVEKNATEALKWFRSSAEQGYAPGQNGLGWMFRYGEGIAKSEMEATKWFRLAAEQGDPKAQVNLGEMYLRGNGVVEDHNEAAKLFRKAAESGYSRGQLQMGNSYFAGKGVPQDNGEAMKWYGKAAEQGEPEAQITIANMYADGYVLPHKEPDNRMADYWYGKATESYRRQAEQGNSLAQLKLAQMYEAGHGEIENRRSSVLGWYRKAAVSGHNYVSEIASKRIRELSDPAIVAKEESVTCVNNLKQIGLALRMWALYHDDKFPFNVSTNGGRGIDGPISGGTMELASRGSDGFDSNSFLIFRVMTNEFHRTLTLVCPSDSERQAAVGFVDLSPSNVSYQVRSGPDVNETNPGEILARCPVHNWILHCDGRTRKARP